MDVRENSEYRYITNGELQTFKGCKRKWWLTYYRKLDKKKEKADGAAQLGTRIHKALASYYVPDGPTEDPMDVFTSECRFATQQVEEGKMDGDLKQLKKDCALGKAILEGYSQWLEETAADSGLRIVAPETAVTANPRMPDLPNVRLLAKLDVELIRESDGARLFMDHKTCQSFRVLTERLPRDEQMLHYHLIKFLNVGEDERTVGAIYNMLRKVKRTATSSPPYYARETVKHNLETLRSYWLRTEHTIKEILQTEEMLNNGADHRSVCAPRPSEDCSWKCQFSSICHLFDDGTHIEDLLRDQYVEVNPLRRYDSEAEGFTV